MSLNSHYAAARHRDGNNQGPSLVRAFGAHVGGALGYWPTDRSSAPLESLLPEHRRTLQVGRALTLFAGTSAHEVDSFQGERFSIV